jgi:hypothetical protein
MPGPSFEEFCADFRQYRAVVGNVLETADSGPLKQQLADVVKFMDEQFTKLVELYPQAMAELQARREAILQQVKENNATLDALEEQAAQRAAKPKVPRGAVTSKPVTIETVPGARLREELLARFGRPKMDDGDRSIREVWEDWDWHDEHQRWQN